MAILQGARITGSIIATTFIKANGFSGSITASNLYVLGKAGIGTTSPTHKLDIRGDVVIKGDSTQHSVLRFRRSDVSAYDFAYIGFENPALGNDAFLISSAGNGNPLKLQAGSSDTITFFGDTVEYARFNGNGNLGIGTTSPTNKLHIYTSDNEPVLIQGTTAGTWLNFQSSTSNLLSIGADGTRGIGFYNRTTAADLMTISNGGNVGIGTNNPSNKLEVDGGSSAATLRVSTTNTGAGVASLILANSSKTANNDGVKISHGAGYTNITDLNSTNIMTWDMTNARVGIGTTSPAQKLDVRGYVVSDVGSNAVEGGFYLGNGNHGLRRPGGSSNDVYLYTTSGVLYIGTTGASSQQVTLLNNGNVGIGTTSPDAILTIKSSSPGPYGIGTPDFAIAGNAGGNLTSLQIYRGANTGSYIGIDAFRSGISGTHLVLNAANNGNVGIGTTDPGRKLHLYAAQSVIKLSNTSLCAWAGLEWSVGTGSYTAYSGLLDSDGRYFIDVGSNGEDFTILQNGNVGIGTTNPVAALDVSRLEYPSLGGVLANFSAGTTDPTTEKYVILRQTYTGALFDSPMLVFKANANSANSGSFGIVRTTSNGSIVFSNVNATSGTVTAVSEKMRITADGNVGIGTSSPEVKLHVRGYQVFLYNDLDTNNTYFYARNSGAGNAGIKMKNSDGEWTIIANDRLRFIDDDAGVERLSILSDGNVGIGFTAPAANLHVFGPTMIVGDSNTTQNVRQTIVGSTTGNASTTAKKIFVCGHTSTGTITVTAIITSVDTASATATFSFANAYGNSVTPNRLSYISLNSTITSIDCSYNNSGYQMEISVTYTGATAPTLYFTAEGMGSSIWTL